jgi:hypothetical protein
VAIYRILQRSAFGPDDLRRLGEAYELALQHLRLHDRDDPLTETVAQYVIEIAQTGEKDPSRVCARALERLGQPRADVVDRSQK